MEADGREARGRRGLLWFRLGFYPLAVALGVFLLLHGRASGDAATMLHGRTSQGEDITLTMQGSRPYSLQTRVVDDCPDRTRRPFSWTPADGVPVRFRVDGSRLRVHERHEESWPGGVRGRLESTLEATFGRGRASGTIAASETITWSSGAAMTCSSGVVRFHAER